MKIKLYKIDNEEEFRVISNLTNIAKQCGCSRQYISHILKYKPNQKIFIINKHRLEIKEKEIR